MKVSFHRYTLKPHLRLGSLSQKTEREGALLRVEFQDDGVGFADCFPWPELGDLTLQDQLNHLQANALTPLLKQTLDFAKKDAQARMMKQSLFEGLRIPPSHALLTSMEGLNEDSLLQKSLAGFSFLKIKCGTHPEREAQLIRRVAPLLKSFKMKVRLDFNHSLKDQNGARTFLDSLDEALERIDFIEDPFPFSWKDWSELQKEYSLRLALDHLPSPQSLQINASHAFSVLIIKPAAQDWNTLLELSHSLGVSTVITSYLDHPLGQLSAAWVAALANIHPHIKLETCGILSHTAYEPHAASALLQSTGPTLHAPAGNGFGLDTYLNSLKWTQLQG